MKKKKEKIEERKKNKKKKSEKKEENRIDCFVAEGGNKLNDYFWLRKVHEKSPKPIAGGTF